MSQTTNTETKSIQIENNYSNPPPEDDWEEYSDNEYEDNNNNTVGPTSSTPDQQGNEESNHKRSYASNYKKGNRYNYDKDYDYHYYGNKKYHRKNQNHNNNKNYYHNTEIKENTTSKYSHDFVNTNSNYSKKPGDKRYNSYSNEFHGILYGMSNIEIGLLYDLTFLILIQVLLIRLALSFCLLITT